MRTNALPAYDASDNPTGCCPRFNPEGWDDRELHFEDKLFVKAKTKSVGHVPTDMGPVFERTFAAIEQAGALDENDLIVLSRDVSSSEAEHFFSVSKLVPKETMERLSGDYVTKVFEGAYENAPQWERHVVTELQLRGLQAGKVFFFYTTCPKCAEVYGKNYVVLVAETKGGGKSID